MTKTTAIKLTSLIILAAVAMSCDGDDERKIVPVAVRHALTQFGSCEAFEAYAKEAAIARATLYIEAAKANLDKNGGGEEEAIDFDDGDSGGDGDGDGDGDEGSDSTDTNVQEEGVDEADLIKTDGQHLYALSEGNLVIVAPGELGAIEEVGRVEVGGYPNEIFLYGNQVVVFSTLDRGSVPPELWLPEPDWYGQGGETDIDIPDDGMVGPWGEYTQVAVFDVTDKQAPALIRTITYNGAYVSSRRIENSLRVVVSTYIPYLDLPVWPEFDEDIYDLPESMAKQKMRNAYNDLLDENEKRMATVTLDQILPKKIDSALGPAAVPIAACQNMYGPVTPSGTGLITVASIDLDNSLVPMEDVSVMSDRGFVYASKTSLYLTTASEYVWRAWGYGLWEEETSGIHKFDISTNVSKAIYLATGTAPGHMLNQFSLGEHNGFLRVATTTGMVWEKESLDNHLLVFEQQGNTLVIVGRLDNLGKGEEVFAARFIGNRGFIVTFYQTDPLFTFDLTDPYNPKVVGEWLGPGYSTYLHPLGENHLISVGVSGERKVAVSLYDLTNFANPLLIQRIEMPEWDSPALHEHKAFTFHPEKGLLALPYNDWYEYMTTGVYLYNVDTTHIAELGRLETLDQTQANEESPVRRTVFIDNTLYAISRCRITSADLSAPSAMLDTLPLFKDGTCDEWWWYW